MSRDCIEGSKKTPFLVEVEFTGVGTYPRKEQI